MARKAKASIVTEDQQISNLTPEERWEKHFPVISAAKKDLDSETATAKKIISAANGVYRNALKQFKKEGGNIKMMIRILEDQKRDAEEVEKDNRDYNAYAKLAGLPVGTQLSIFGDGGDKGVKPADDFKEGPPISTEESIRRAKTQGFDDGAAGKTAFNAFPEGSPEALAYQGGWNDAQAKIARGLGKKGKKADATAEATA